MARKCVCAPPIKIVYVEPQQREVEIRVSSGIVYGPPPQRDCWDYVPRVGWVYFKHRT